MLELIGQGRGDVHWTDWIDDKDSTLHLYSRGMHYFRPPEYLKAAGSISQERALLAAHRLAAMWAEGLEVTP